MLSKIFDIVLTTRKDDPQLENLMIFTPEFWSALLAILVIDIILAGDNAIIIGMAARNVDKLQQRKVILLGTAGAILVRVLATVGVVYLLKVPGLMLGGGIALFYIAFKLLTENRDHEIEAKSTFWCAVRTIVAADAIMGLDNVLAVAGAAQGNISLVVIGLLITIPLVIYGSTLFVTLIEKYPSIITFGALIIAYTAITMIINDSITQSYYEFKGLSYWALVTVTLGTFFFAGNWVTAQSQSEKVRSVAENVRN